MFDEKPGSYDICPICGWEDDLSQLRFPTTDGANSPLIECQQSFLASTRANPARIEKTEGAVERDPDWRPIDLDTDDIEVPTDGVDYGMTYPHDATTLYYWRGSYWRRSRG